MAGAGADASVRPMTDAAPSRLFAGDASPLLARLGDALAWPLIVVDAQAVLLHANRAARLLLADGTHLRLAPGRCVQAVAKPQQVSFAAAMRAAGGGSSTQLRWPAEGGTWTLTVQPLSRAHDSRPLVLLAGSPLHASGIDLGLQGIAQSWSLTPTQTRVLHLLCLGQGASAVAQALGVAPSTARTHIQALRQKSGYDSVAMLIASLNRLPPPLLPLDKGQ